MFSFGKQTVASQVTYPYLREFLAKLNMMAELHVHTTERPCQALHSWGSDFHKTQHYLEYVDFITSTSKSLDFQVYNYARFRATITFLIQPPSVKQYQHHQKRNWIFSFRFKFHKHEFLQRFSWLCPYCCSCNCHPSQCGASISVPAHNPRTQFDSSATACRYVSHLKINSAYTS